MLPRLQYTSSGGCCLELFHKYLDFNDFDAPFEIIPFGIEKRTSANLFLRPRMASLTIFAPVVPPVVPWPLSPADV